MSGVLWAAFLLRTVHLSSLSFWGDQAYSLYVAHQDLWTITVERVSDGHPPLYYYLLHFWVRLAGDSEYSARFLSVIPGVLTVGLVYAWGSRAFSRRVGLVAAALVAVSPFLLYYSRLPRMYALLAMLGALAAYAYLRLAAGRCPELVEGRERPLGSTQGRGWWFVLGGALLLAAYTHYYGVLLFAVFSPALLLRLRTRRAPLTPWLALHAACAALYLPWLFYAVRGSAEATGAIISNYPTPSHLAALIEQVGLVLVSGELLTIGWARLLAAGVLAIVALAAVWGSRRWEEVGRSSDGWALLVAYLGVPLALGAVMYLVYPPFVRPRFYIFLAPAALLLLAALSHLPPAAWQRAASSLLLVGVLGAALPRTFYAEAHIQEIDAVETTQFLAERAYTEDGLLFHAFWQLGYLRSHWDGAVPEGYALRDTDIAELPQLLSRHRRLWLVMFRAALRDPAYPQEAWLDEHANLAFTWWNRDTRIKLYTSPLQALPPVAVAANFGDELELLTYGPPPERLEAGDVVAVSLRWKALAAPRQRYTTFLHLLDSAGRYVVGEDGEPVDGSRPTDGWRAGEEVIDRRALYVPPTVPPGRYLLEAGLYESSSGKRLPIVNRNEPEDRVLLGGVEITPIATSHVRPRHLVDPPLPGLETLVGYDLSSDLWREGRAETFRAPPGPSGLSFPAPLRGGDALSVTLYWRSGSFQGPTTVRLRLLADQVEPLAVTAPIPAAAFDHTRGPGEDTVVAQQLTLVLPHQEEPQRYQVQLALEPDGTAAPPRFVDLAEIEVMPPVSSKRGDAN